MYIRLSFESGQKISTKELRELEQTLSDEIDYKSLYHKLDDKLEPIYSWQDTDDPSKVDEKHKLVTLSDFVSLEPNTEYFADLELFLTKHPNIKIKIRGTPKTIEKDYTSMIAMISQIQEKFENALKSFDQQVEFNQKCDVHISNMGLLHINQLAYATDYCTENLQEHLNKGWRIIACCVQADGRRPDYILGRYNPDEENLKCVQF